MAEHPALPPLPTILSSDASTNSALAHALSTLLEPTPILLNTLVPQLATRLRLASLPVSYAQLIDRTIEVVNSWDDSLRAQFIHGHPRIGEVRNVSRLSAQEQSGTAGAGGNAGTPPEVLARLAFLNKCYEKRYPGLVYITFVNGRSRAEIKDEMEEMLSAEGSLPAGEEAIDSIQPHNNMSSIWRMELDRAVGDVSKIAKSRLSKFAVE